MPSSTSICRGADSLPGASAGRLNREASATPPAILRHLVALALGAGLSFGAQAAVIVSAFSVSGAQVTQQGNTSSAYIIDGVPQFVVAGPGGSSSVGGSAHSLWADTWQTDVNGQAAVQANTYAAADLTSGRLRVYAEAGTANVQGFFSSQASGQARWLDTIAFNNTANQAVELDFFWQTDGSITPQLANSWRSVTSSIVLSRASSSVGLKAANGDYLNFLGGAQYNYYGVDANGGDYFTFQPTGNNAAGAWRTSLLDGESGLIAATLFIPVGLSEIYINAQLDVDCRSGAICDFGHTATFGFGALPAGLSWTSESGVFLTASDPPPPGTVPEPATLALLALSFAGLGIARRKRV